jgi:hypothetical protein
VEKAIGFGEAEERRSEPDLILEDDRALVFVENKLTSTNRSVPSHPKNAKKYETGFERWFSTVFQRSATFKSVAVEAKLYELMRLWLIGWRIASEMGKRFILVNVVREAATSESDISAKFASYARLDHTSREFIRLTWESIRDVVIESGQPNADKQRLLGYLRGKTLGYAGGHLRRAFET